MSDDALVDERYYQVVPSGSLAERVLVAARDRIYADFVRRIRPQPGDRLLDAGVSDVISPAANLLERLYPHPGQITAVGLGTAMDFIKAFPPVTYQQIEPHAPMPFADQSFDIACSNAVVEHLGSTEHQRRFVAELARVARRVFITVPNRLFPVEHHTALPLAAWTDPTFRLATKLTRRAEWSDPANLILMSPRRLRALCPPGRRGQVGISGLKLGPFSSNLYLAIDES